MDFHFYVTLVTAVTMILIYTAFPVTTVTAVTFLKRWAQYS